MPLVTGLSKIMAARLMASFRPSVCLALCKSRAGIRFPIQRAPPISPSPPSLADSLPSVGLTSPPVDFPTDGGNFLLNGVPTLLAVNSIMSSSGNFSIFLNQGDVFGFEVFTLDNAGAPGFLKISNFDGPVGNAVPEAGGTFRPACAGCSGFGNISPSQQSLGEK